MRASLIVLALVVACGPSRRPPGGDCTDGAMQCNGQVLQTCVSGEFTDSQTCDNACSATLGCTLCVPGTATCNGNSAHACNDAGDGYVDSTCDPVQGVTCDPQQGGCTGACAPKTLGTSYIGCDYYPTVVGNTVGEVFDFAVAVANTTNVPAMLTIEGGTLTSSQMVS